MTPLTYTLTAIALVIGLTWVFSPNRKLKQQRENEYLKLYIEIQNKLNQPILSTSELIEVQRMLCLLESLKHKNSEMTDVITLQWVKRRYGMSKKEMAETIGN